MSQDPKRVRKPDLAFWAKGRAGTEPCGADQEPEEGRASCWRGAEGLRTREPLVGMSQGTEIEAGLQTQ